MPRLPPVTTTRLFVKSNGIVHLAHRYFVARSLAADTGAQRRSSTRPDSDAFRAVARAASPETRSFQRSSMPLRRPFCAMLRPCSGNADDVGSAVDVDFAPKLLVQSGHHRAPPRWLASTSRAHGAGTQRRLARCVNGRQHELRRPAKGSACLRRLACRRCNQRSQRSEQGNEGVQRASSAYSAIQMDAPTQVANHDPLHRGQIGRACRGCASAQVSIGTDHGCHCPGGRGSGCDLHQGCTQFRAQHARPS